MKSLSKLTLAIALSTIAASGYAQTLYYKYGQLDGSGAEAATVFTQYSNSNLTTILKKGSYDYAKTPPTLTIKTYRDGKVVSTETGTLKTIKTSVRGPLFNTYSKVFSGQATVTNAGGKVVEKKTYNITETTYTATVTYPAGTPKQGDTTTQKLDILTGNPASSTTTNKAGATISSATYAYADGVPTSSTTYSFNKNGKTNHIAVLTYKNGLKNENRIAYMKADGKTTNGIVTIQAYTNNQITSQKTMSNNVTLSSTQFKNDANGTHVTSEIALYTNGKKNGLTINRTYSNGQPATETEYNSSQQKLSVTTFTTNSSGSITGSSVNYSPTGALIGTTTKTYNSAFQLTSKTNYNVANIKTSEQTYTNEALTSQTNYDATGTIRTSVNQFTKGKVSSTTFYDATGKNKTSVETLSSTGLVMTKINYDANQKATSTTKNIYSKTGTYQSVTTYTNGTTPQKIDNYTAKGVLIVPVQPKSHTIPIPKTTTTNKANSTAFSTTTERDSHPPSSGPTNNNAFSN